MKNSKKAAIIGFGGMGQRHYKAYSKTGTDVMAICDMQYEKIPELIPGFSEKHIYPTYSELLENENPDILSVVTNGPTHAEITKFASEYGVKNILCEKPIATNLKDAKEVIEVCNKNSTRLAINHIRRWSSNYHRIKKLIKDGMIGDIRHIYFNSGSTGLGNFAIHFFDTARFLTDSEPDWTVGFIDKTGTPNPRGLQFQDPGGYGIIQFKNGARFFCDTSEDMGVQYTFQIVGTYGRIIIDELNDIWDIRARKPDLRDIPLTRYGTQMDIVPFKSDSAFDIVDLTSMAQAELLSGGEISSKGSDGFKSLEMVIALHMSDIENNSRIKFPLSNDASEITVNIG